MKIATYKDLIKIKTLESGEEMVNISEELINCICVCHKPDMLKYTSSDIWTRKGVVVKLHNIAQKLRKKFPDYKLKIVYGYRHPSIQKKYFLQRRRIEQFINKNLKEEKLNQITHEKVAFPLVAGHPTGGALDLTIITSKGELNMGTGIAEYSDLEKIKTFSLLINEKQKNNRKLLHDLMLSEGFAPFCGEWWHFSFGDKEWAWFYNKPNAIYDQIDFKSIKKKRP